MSTLSQFAPFAGGGLKSFQTGYITASSTAGSGEDQTYTDVTISSSSTSKSIPGFYGAGINGNFTVAYYALDTGGGYNSFIVFPRLTSSTNLRLSAIGATKISGRWQVAEAN
jgi:hypothetical protein